MCCTCFASKNLTLIHIYKWTISGAVYVAGLHAVLVLGKEEHFETSLQSQYQWHATCKTSLGTEADDFWILREKVSCPGKNRASKTPSEKVPLVFPTCSSLSAVDLARLRPCLRTPWASVWWDSTMYLKKAERGMAKPLPMRTHEKQ